MFEITFCLRIGAALAAAFCGVLVGQDFARRADRSDVAVYRGWLVTSAVICGACLWAAHLCLAMATGGITVMPLGNSALALVLATGSVAAGLAALGMRRRQYRVLAGLGAAFLALSEVGVWAICMGWRAQPGPLMAAFLAAMAAQGVWTTFLWRRPRSADKPWSRHLVPAGVAIAQLLALMAGGWHRPAAALAVPGPELLFALLCAAMALLVLQAARMERHLVGKQRMLGARLQQANANLERTPLSDPLTGLLSRLGMEGALRKSAGEAEAQGQRIALLAVGLDGFKSVNDSFGHALGDTVLREVARRLGQEALGMVAPPAIVSQELARLGADEFVVMLHGQLDRRMLGDAAHRLLDALDAPVDCAGHDLRVSASIGIACFPEDGGATKLISRANAAMQAAKSAGGSSYALFEPRMQDDARDRHELLRDLRHAIDNRQLELFYQPKIDARSGQVTAAEALLRWHHPVRGLVGPDVFIPLAERHGLIGALGNWVIEDACRQARVWRERGLKMRVAINLSVFQMRQTDLVERLQAALRRHGVNPSRLTCEITESVAMEDTQVTQRTFERLGQAGIHLSIDDFGTGYSSLSYLRRLPATELKIDRSFVMDLDTSADARAIVDAVLKLAHAIGLKVVAEGVENVRQRDILMSLGCDEFQGYLFARPMSARALTLWAADDRASKNAFRPSLFAETDIPSVADARSLLPASVQSLSYGLRRRMARRA